MSDRSKINTVIVAFVIIAFSIAVFIPVYNYNEVQASRPATFVISSWSYPDAYGQGILFIKVYENSTGSWVHVDDVYYYNTTIFSWNHSVGIKLYVYTWFNSTLSDATNTTEGQAYQRHNITVTDAFGTELYSKENMTYFLVSDAYDPMYYYAYEHELDWMPVPAQQCYITVTYEIYYKSGGV